MQDKLVDDVEALPKVDSHEEERHVAKSDGQSGDTTKNVKETSKVTEDKSVRKYDPANAAPSSSSDDSASGSSLTSSDDDNSNATDTSSSDDGHGPPGPPSPPRGSSPSDSSSESDTAARKRPATPSKRKERLEKADKINVIRPANSRFKTLLDYRTYFLIRPHLTYTHEEAKRSHRLKNRFCRSVLRATAIHGSFSLGYLHVLDDISPRVRRGWADARSSPSANGLLTSRQRQDGLVWRV